MQPFIKYLRIENYKSIDKLELHDLPPFAVFAGANGSGKSNFFDALEFVSHFVRFSIDEALRLHGGFNNTHCFRRSSENNTTFAFEIELKFEIEGSKVPEHPEGILASDRYKILVTKLDTEPVLQEWYKTPFDKDYLQSRNGTEAMSHNLTVSDFTINKLKPIITFQDSVFHIPNTTTVLNHIGSQLVDALRTMRVFAINPDEAKGFNRSDRNKAELNRNGNNLALVLARLQEDDEIREIILDFMSLCVPSLDNISVKKQSLDDSAILLFKETGTDKEFPAHLISDGTIYLLNLLVAILDVKKRIGITMIEEPERGLHPEAISQIVAFMRERATSRNPIWLTTHSEAVVRATQEGDLFFVEKEDGRTVIKPALPYTNGSFSRDQAWLSNALGGGLPW